MALVVAKVKPNSTEQPNSPCPVYYSETYLIVYVAKCITCLNVWKMVGMDLVPTVRTQIVATVTSHNGPMVALGPVESCHAQGVHFYWRNLAKIHKKNSKKILYIIKMYLLYE